MLCWAPCQALGIAQWARWTQPLPSRHLPSHVFFILTYSFFSPLNIHLLFGYIKSYLQHVESLSQCVGFSVGAVCGFHSSWALWFVAHRVSCPAACEILVPQPEIEPASPALEDGLSTTGPRGMSQPIASYLLLPLVDEPHWCVQSTLIHMSLFGWYDEVPISQMGKLSFGVTCSGWLSSGNPSNNNIQHALDSNQFEHHMLHHTALARFQLVRASHTTSHTWSPRAFFRMRKLKFPNVMGW